MNNELIFATSNQNKIREILELLKNEKYVIKSLKDISFHEEIPETSNTFKGNALQKSKYIHDRIKTNIFSEDSGLEVNCLNKEPGIRSARYAGEQKDDNNNIDLLLKNLKNKIDRSAQFKTVISLILNNEEFFFEGVIKGHISFERSGTGGFGYDSIFVPEGSSKSFAHYTKLEKNEISHRGQAVRKLIHFLKEQN